MSCIDIHTHRPADGVTALLTAGIHPWHAAGCDIADAAALAAALGSRLDCAQAIGETGLDRACSVPQQAQLKLLHAHLELAAERRMPVVLHCVRAFEPVMRILAGYDLSAVIFHGFVGSPQQARRAVQHGYMLSFGVRSMRSPRTVEAMRSVPPENIFLETDDDPVPIGEVYALAAGILGVGLPVLEAQLCENYKRLTQHG